VAEPLFGLTRGTRDGALAMSGGASFQGTTLDQVDLRIVADKLWLTYVNDTQLRVSADPLTVVGTFPNLRVRGSVFLDEGFLNLDEEDFLADSTLQLDPTLRRIARYSERNGYDGFWMANIFALRTPYPKEMMAHPDPVGPENDASLLAAAARCDRIVAAWGVSGAYQARADAVIRLFGDRELWCLGTTQAGHPRHPLYVAGDQKLVRFTPQVV
jgi:hypothetical protein